jgi:hypothetical protein
MKKKHVVTALNYGIPPKQHGGRPRKNRPVPKVDPYASGGRLEGFKQRLNRPPRATTGRGGENERL